jgi:serine/threonine-protein kinase
MSLDESSRLSVLPGEVLAGTYRIERVLGEGGMGVVLLGRHLRLDKQVAIKLLRAEAVRALGVSRFIQEARIAAKLKGEHVAKVYDVDEINGTPYLIMEYLEGCTLAAELDRTGPFSVERAIDCVLEASEALAEAHGLGIVHRDVKLENLFLARLPDGRSSVKLLDFGVSKILGADSMTRTAALVGSPVYMAPEQLESSKDVDARADIWSLGVVLYELLTNAQPFQGDSLPQLCVSIREHATPSLQDQRPDVPAQVDRAVQRCLSKRREDRYQSIAELVADLAPAASDSARISADSVRRMARAAAATLDFQGATQAGDTTPISAPTSRRPRSGSVAASVSIAKPEPVKKRKLVWAAIALAIVAVVVGVATVAPSLKPDPSSVAATPPPPPPPAPSQTETATPPPQPAASPVVPATSTTATQVARVSSPPPRAIQREQRAKKKEQAKPAAPTSAPTLDPLGEPQ